MKAWSKYSQVLNDPVRNLNMRLTFQNGDVTMVHSHHPTKVRRAPFLIILARLLRRIPKSRSIFFLYLHLLDRRLPGVDGSQHHGAGSSAR